MNWHIITVAATLLAALAACSQSTTQAPDFSLKGAAPAESAHSLSENRGKWVLLQFWSSEDARSRISAYDTERLAHREGVKYISVNLDKSSSLMREIARIDGLDPGNMLFAPATEARRLVRGYNMTDSLHYYLIDPQGRIVATDPSAQAIERAITRS